MRYSESLLILRAVVERAIVIPVTRYTIRSLLGGWSPLNPWANPVSS